MNEHNPKKVRPPRDWCSILCDERREATFGGIFLPDYETGAEKVTEKAGVVVRVGPGEKNETLGLKEGMRVLYRGFLKHANPIHTGEKWPSGVEKEYFLISSEDIMGEIGDGVEVGVFSGRPSNPEMK